MNISYEKPPVFDNLNKYFGIQWPGSVVVTYGDTIHSGSSLPISADLLCHEKTHMKQQLSMGVDAWWQRYLEDPAFRLSQEIEAYKNQSTFIKKTIKDRERSFAMRVRLAKDCASPMYGNIITMKEALDLII